MFRDIQKEASLFIILSNRSCLQVVTFECLFNIYFTNTTKQKHILIPVRSKRQSRMQHKPHSITGMSPNSKFSTKAKRLQQHLISHKLRHIS